MSNQIANNIVVEGTPVALKNFLIENKEALENDEFFNKLIQIPQQVEDENDWKQKNWSCGREAEEISVTEISDTELSLHFITLNSHCDGIVRTLADKYPNLKFDVAFSDEGVIGNSGWYLIARNRGIDTSDSAWNISDSSDARWEILSRTWGEDIFCPEDKDEYIYTNSTFIIRGSWDDDGYFQVYVHQLENDCYVAKEMDGCCLETSPEVDFREAFNSALDLLDLDEAVIEQFKSRNVNEFDKDDYYDLI